MAMTTVALAIVTLVAYGLLAPVPPQGSPLWLSAPASARCRAQEHAAALLPAESGPTPAAARTLLIPEIEYEEQSL